ncbi:peptide chain release factor N(5)-glutamine methyltransferase [Corynebacterium alimapuense]|uniref:Release factor glutamine methyltransferase n=1 Tax=Corynebacterium alimapuense TaxID=1576874 RepID=A0A3M8K5A2_9CORY|nr:peptide chain release factor N(5)-glutamine methyltransferase [Corynebacterium alimapuense]RNE48403.1 peptide chain release factor N(5)-glutamine methyltransferase [Corynebacterium alimapuense]
MSLNQALRDAADILRSAGVPSPEVDARLLAAGLLGVGPLELFGRSTVPEGFWEAVRRRELREPLQHILGSAPFGPLDLQVGEGVFIPRPETEVLADWAVGQLKRIDAANPRIVDLCTGSGALALYLADACPSARIAGVEKQDDALRWALRNAEGTGVEMLRGDVTDPDTLSEWHRSVDLVVTNPPYVPLTQDLDPEVYLDPPEAVFAGNTGMDVIDAMLPLIYNLLIPGGVVGIEHDDTTSDAVQSALLTHGGFDTVTVLTDLAGRARFVTASKVSV